ncbi:hypothetical protein G7070_15965 [Propioniciclava coleopterorum]|uniref:Uncharacterized protein n=1 Tax=Propioniciclava coleopterorum TaxID=2714937 RepID=A0A6G7Y9I6_9ACTN|nr:hypothetical protein [Propioniciclava coleopterorum]QIK73482.1 hypothetical protein G7070_15965 [Propioniciclava coleopterorum]
MSHRSWDTLPLDTSIGALEGTSFLAAADRDNHVVGSVLRPRTATSSARFVETLTTRGGSSGRRSREVNPGLSLAALCALLGVAPMSAIALPAVDWLNVSTDSVRAGEKFWRLPTLLDRVPTPQNRLEQCRARVEAVKQSYGRLRGDLVYRIENAALFDPDAPLTRQFETALVLWEDVDATTPDSEMLRRAGMVEVTFDTARAAAETVGLAHLPETTRGDADRAAKAARLARATDVDAERAIATDRVAGILRRLDLPYLPDPTVLDRALTRG